MQKQQTYNKREAYHCMLMPEKYINSAIAMQLMEEEGRNNARG